MLGLAIEFDLMSRTKSTVPSIEDYYSKLNLVAFLRNDSLKGTIDRANETLMLDDRMVMIIAGVHDAFMDKKKLGPNQRGDRYKMQVAAGSTHVAIGMEFMRTQDSTIIRTVDEIESAYGASRSTLFSMSDEILKTLRLNRIQVDGIEYAKRSVDLTIGALVASGAIDAKNNYAGRAKDLLVNLLGNGGDFIINPRSSGACAVVNVLHQSGLKIEPGKVARAAGLSAGGFYRPYNDFNDKLKQM